MKETGCIRHYFLEAFTPYGYISLLPEIMRKKPVTYLLTGKIGTGKSTVLKLVALRLIDRGYEVDYIRSLREPDSVAGVFLPHYQIILLDQQEFDWRAIDTESPGFRQVDFVCFCDEGKLERFSKQIHAMEKKLEQLEQRILTWLSETGSSEGGLFSLQAFLSGRVVAGTKSGGEIGNIMEKIKESDVSYCFLHGLQKEGWLNLSPRFLKDCDKICLDGQEAAAMLREIMKETQRLGQRVEIVLHPWQADQILGLVFPEKKLVIWQGSPNCLEEQGLFPPDRELLQLLGDYQKNRKDFKSFMNDIVQFHTMDDLKSRLVGSILNEVREK